MVTKENLDPMIANMNFWIEQLPAERRLQFFHWLKEHFHVLGTNLTLDHPLDARFRGWLESLPAEIQMREIFIILSEIAWVGVFHNKIHPYVKMPARSSL
jgi:hypothetical protein